MLAASSLSEALHAIDPAASFSFGGSDRLAFQIEQGRPPTSSPRPAPRTPRPSTTRGWCWPPRVFATNRLAVIVPAANPAGIRAVADLAEARRHAGDRRPRACPSAPTPALPWRALASGTPLANVVSEEQDAAAIVAKVALGEADAGLAYVTDAASARGQGDRHPGALAGRSPSSSTPSRWCAPPATGPPPTPSSRGSLGPRGRAVLARLGFGLPEGG